MNFKGRNSLGYREKEEATRKGFCSYRLNCQNVFLFASIAANFKAIFLVRNLIYKVVMTRSIYLFNKARSVESTLPSLFVSAFKSCFSVSRILRSKCLLASEGLLSLYFRHRLYRQMHIIILLTAGVPKNCSSAIFPYCRPGQIADIAEAGWIVYIHEVNVPEPGSEVMVNSVTASLKSSLFAP